MTKSQSKQANTSWLNVIESEPPRYRCPVMDVQLMGPCQLRGCILWTSNIKAYNCVGAFAGMKSANSEERLQATSAAQREKRGTLRAAADGKLSFYDLAHMYGFSRQRVEGLVSYGRQVMETLAPMFADVELTSESNKAPAKRRLGSPTLFTYSHPTAHEDANGDVTRVCICCENIIEPDDDEVVLAIIDRAEVVWCSRQCAKEYPIDAYLVANRYKRHWSDVALEKDEVDERSRVREITLERMETIKDLAIKQGY